MNKNEIWKSYRFPLILLGGIFLGALIGVIWGKQAAVLKPLGDIFINLMFTIVAPMVFFSIANAVGSMLNLKRLGKILGSLILTFVTTGLFAAAVVLIVVNIFPPASGVQVSMQGVELAKPISAGEMLVKTLTVDDFPKIFSRSNMLPCIIAAIFTGVAVSMNGGQDSPLGKVIANINCVIMTLIDMVMKLAPIGLGAYFANLVGEYGPQLIGHYGGRCSSTTPCVCSILSSFSVDMLIMRAANEVSAHFGAIY